MSEQDDLAARIIARWERAYRKKYPHGHPRPSFDKFDPKHSLATLVNYFEQERRQAGPAQSTIDAENYRKRKGK